MKQWTIFSVVVSLCIVLAFIFFGLDILQVAVIRVFSVITVLSAIMGLISPLVRIPRFPNPSAPEWRILLLFFLISGLIGSFALNGIYWSKLNKLASLQTKAPLLSDFQRNNNGRFSFLDPLESNNPNNASTTYQNGWDVGDNCSFKEKEGYHVRFSQRRSCLGESLLASNFALQVNVKIVEGSQAGLLFRWSEEGKNPSKYYLFHIGTNDTYGFDIGTGNKSSPLQIGISDMPAPLPIERSQWYQLSVIAVGGNIDLYINGKHLGKYPSIMDITAQQGKIGLDVGDQIDVTNEAVFSHLELYKYN